MDNSRKLPSGEVIRDSLRADLEAAEREYKAWMNLNPSFDSDYALESISKWHNLYFETLKAYMEESGQVKSTSERSKSVHQVGEIDLGLEAIKYLVVPSIISGFCLILMSLGVI